MHVRIQTTVDFVFYMHYADRMTWPT